MGKMVFVSACNGVSSNEEVCEDFRKQCEVALNTLKDSLHKVDAKLSHVARLRVFLLDLTNFALFKEIVAEVFGDQQPIITVVEVSKLLTPQSQLEVEADAVLI